MPVIEQKTEPKVAAVPTGQLNTSHLSIKKMMEKRLVITLESLNERYTPKTAVYVELTAEYSDEQSLTELLSQLEHKKSAEKQIVSETNTLAQEARDQIKEANDLIERINEKM